MEAPTRFSELLKKYKFETHERWKEEVAKHHTTKGNRQHYGSLTVWSHYEAMRRAVELVIAAHIFRGVQLTDEYFNGVKYVCDALLNNDTGRKGESDRA